MSRPDPIPSYTGRRLREKIEHFDEAGAMVSYTDYAYDDQDRLISAWHKKADGSTVERYEYTYDEGENNKGLRTSQTRTLADGTVQTVRYDYDDLYQLVEAGTWEGDTLVYDYDEVGNMTEVKRVKDGVEREIRTYRLYGAGPHRGMNRLEEIGYDMNGDRDVEDVGDYTMSMGYDGNGNMTGRDVVYAGGGMDEFWDYEYDGDDRMIAVYRDGEMVAEYGYDAVGRRSVKRVVGEEARAYFYDREDVLGEVKSAGVWARSYVNGPGIDDYISMTVTGCGGEAEYFYRADGLGSVTGLTGRADAGLVAQYEYGPFGEAGVIEGEAAAAMNPHQYTGRDLDAETGLMYYRSRYYSPGMGRFVGEDKFSGYLIIPSSFTIKYGYVSNNPIDYIDPNGEELLTIGAILVLLGFISLGAVGASNRRDDPKNLEDNPFADAMAFGLVATPFAYVATPYIVAILCGGGAAASSSAFKSPNWLKPLTSQDWKRLNAVQAEGLHRGAFINELASILSEKGIPANEIIQALGPLRGQIPNPEILIK